MNSKSTIKNLIWLLVTVALAAITIYVIFRQNKSFSFGSFLDYVSSASPLFIILAFVSMLGIIIFEALAVLRVCHAFGYKRSFGRGLLYSMADLYFSAITPSATGGQPASAYIMIKDDIPAGVTTISLLVNLILYTLSIILVGTVCFFIRPSVFMGLGAISKILVIFGLVIQVLLIAFLLLLIRREKIVQKVCDVVLVLLVRMRLLKDLEGKRKRLAKLIGDYRECAQVMGKNKRMLVEVLLLDICQRLSLILVTMFAFLGTGGSPSALIDVFALQSFALLGSCVMPIPGSIGVADYLLIDGFRSLPVSVVDIELLSRGISFYSCVILCGLVVFCYLIVERRRQRLHER